ncbi:dihydrofolate reductase family protein [Kribbella sp. HUAS MG21]|uniref:Dihydrofolate reductase family protein n=1 Tax=Kribbella sp. HUAS MG21 TaxID=3160966 RepID=A0AAU7TD25_9ACTN
MSASYTWDIFCTLDGFGSYDENGDWGGYWGKGGPEFIGRRVALYRDDVRMVLGGNTYRQFLEVLGPSVEEAKFDDQVNLRMLTLPTTVVSSTLESPLRWKNATVEAGDAVDVVARLKHESELPLRSVGSVAMNNALMAAGLVDLVQVTIFPVISGRTGADPIFAKAADFDLTLVEARTLDNHTQELIYHPTLHA